MLPGLLAPLLPSGKTVWRSVLRNVVCTPRRAAAGALRFQGLQVPRGCSAARAAATCMHTYARGCMLERQSRI